MNQEQFDKLQALQERLTDVFLDEADPQSWPGVGIPLANMDKDTRGDRYWSKKNAAATISLMQRIVNLTDSIRRRTLEGDLGGVGEQPEVDIDKEIDAAEREAARLLDQVQRNVRKASFDEHVHGKRRE
jgi:hypothetical protein